MKSINKLLWALAAGLAATAAGAQTASMAVSAAVTGSCSVVANPLAFSVYDPASPTALSAQSSTIVTCTTGAGASIAMGIGSNATGTGPSAQRRMRIGATSNYLPYSIFQPASSAESAACAYTTAWGNGTTGGSTLAVGVAPSPTARTYNICGQIAAGQSAGIGSYTDSVTITVNL